ncbi:MAG: ABC transporter substrate-binding protein [Methylococcaceae bacterium]|nr:ABC transporter substrate-binding protein [Methylococcaceae bacterium]
MNRLRWSLLLILTFWALGLPAVTPVAMQPMDRLVKETVGSVKPAPLVKVPIITWGGDIATVHGNGDATLPQPGSLFSKLGLSLRLIRQDAFAQQVADYLKGETPYLRGTIGMLNQASDLLNKDPRTQPVIIYQMTWSAGGDALVVKEDIRTAADLKGKTIALQAFGPHVDYLLRVLADAGLSPEDVTLVWTRDLTGTSETAAEAFRGKDADAAFVIIPDGLALTSGGAVGTGSEDSVKGAKILVSTKTANRIIADVYAVRSDYFQANKDLVEKFVRGLMQADESLHGIMADKAKQPQAYEKVVKAAAKALMDSEQAVADTEGMYRDAEFVGFDGNIKFFAQPTFPRRMEVLNQEAQAGLAKLGLVKGDAHFAQAQWNYALLKTGLTRVDKAEAPRFDETKLADVVSKRQQQGNLKQGELFSFEVYFTPNQTGFSADLYKDAFDRVISLASTYGGAVITVEGHSDPLGYLRKQKENAPPLVLGQIKQSAKNLSLGRAQGVRDSIIQYAAAKGISLDPSQFAVIGHGIAAPKSGLCGNDPCAPKNEQEWRSNMRVEFRILQMEAEESVFKPL